jgi:putative hemolysin
MYQRITITVLAACLALAACGDDEPNEGNQGLPNPASVYCEEQGGTLEIREEAAGQYGVCVFDDGSECREWAFYHGECEPGQTAGLANPASVHCLDQGGTLEMRDGEGGVFGVCIFADGSECEEWAYFRGECEPAG